MAYHNTKWYLSSAVYLLGLKIVVAVPNRNILWLPSHTSPNLESVLEGKLLARLNSFTA